MIKIVAESKENFEKIENGLKILGENFVKQFSTAEETFGSISLSTEYFAEEKIYISADKIHKIYVETDTTYEKLDQKLNAKYRYNIFILFTKKEQFFGLRLKNRYNPNIKIEFL